MFGRFLHVKLLIFGSLGDHLLYANSYIPDYMSCHTRICKMIILLLSYYAACAVAGSQLCCAVDILYNRDIEIDYELALHDHLGYLVRVCKMRTGLVGEARPCI